MGWCRVLVFTHTFSNAAIDKRLSTEQCVVPRITHSGSMCKPSQPERLKLVSDAVETMPCLCLSHNDMQCVAEEPAFCTLQSVSQLVAGLDIQQQYATDTHVVQTRL